MTQTPLSIIADCFSSIISRMILKLYLLVLAVQIFTNQYDRYLLCSCSASKLRQEEKTKKTKFNHTPSNIKGKTQENNLPSIIIKRHHISHTNSIASRDNYMIVDCFEDCFHGKFDSINDIAVKMMNTTSSTNQDYLFYRFEMLSACNCCIMFALEIIDDLITPLVPASSSKTSNGSSTNRSRDHMIKRRNDVGDEKNDEERDMQKHKMLRRIQTYCTPYLQLVSTEKLSSKVIEKATQRLPYYSRYLCFDPPSNILNVTKSINRKLIYKRTSRGVNDSRIKNSGSHHHIDFVHHEPHNKVKEKESDLNTTFDSGDTITTSSTTMTNKGKRQQTISNMFNSSRQPLILQHSLLLVANYTKEDSLTLSDVRISKMLKHLKWLRHVLVLSRSVNIHLSSKNYDCANEDAAASFSPTSAGVKSGSEQEKEQQQQDGHHDEKTLNHNDKNYSSCEINEQGLSLGLQQLSKRRIISSAFSSGTNLEFLSSLSSKSFQELNKNEKNHTKLQALNNTGGNDRRNSSKRNAVNSSSFKEKYIKEEKLLSTIDCSNMTTTASDYHDYNLLCLIQDGDDGCQINHVTKLKTNLDGYNTKSIFMISLSCEEKNCAGDGDDFEGVSLTTRTNDSSVLLHENYSSTEEMSDTPPIICEDQRRKELTTRNLPNPCQIYYTSKVVKNHEFDCNIGIDEARNIKMIENTPRLRPILNDHVFGFPTLLVPIAHFFYKEQISTAPFQAKCRGGIRKQLHGGCINFVSLMPQASGIRFDKFIAEYRDNPSNENEYRVQKAFSLLGFELGNFHALHMDGIAYRLVKCTTTETNISNCWKEKILTPTIIHGDFHHGNVFYKEKPHYENHCYFATTVSGNTREEDYSHHQDNLTSPSAPFILSLTTQKVLYFQIVRYQNCISNHNDDLLPRKRRRRGETICAKRYNSFSFIDNESIASSIAVHKNPSIDILYIAFVTIKNRKIKLFENLTKGMDLIHWYNISFKKLIEGYVESFLLMMIESPPALEEEVDHDEDAFMIRRNIIENNNKKNKVFKKQPSYFDRGLYHDNRRDHVESDSLMVSNKIPRPATSKLGVQMTTIEKSFCLLRIKLLRELKAMCNNYPKTIEEVVFIRWGMPIKDQKHLFQFYINPVFDELILDSAGPPDHPEEW